jgi:hypothetical protein
MSTPEIRLHFSRTPAYEMQQKTIAATGDSRFVLFEIRRI